MSDDAPNVSPPTGGATASHERHLVSHVFNIVVFVVGGAALAAMIHRLGIANVRRVFGDIGVWFAPIIALDLGAMACDAGAIHAFMAPESRMVSYARVLAAQASGRAINVLTPGGALGEATKIAMLVGHAPRARIVAAIVQYNLVTLYLSVIVIAIGLPVTTALVDLPARIEVVAWVGLAVVVVAVAALIVIMRRGAARTLLAGARGVRVISAARLEAWRDKLGDLDRQLRELHDNRSPGMRRGIGLLVASRLCSWAATTAVLVAVGVSISGTLLVGVLSVGILISWVSSVVPLGVGIADGGNYALFGVLGASGAHGVLVTMVGRARSLIVALIGLAVMVVAHTATRVSLARRRLRHHDSPRYGG